jgi:hypothetical protein
LKKLLNKIADRKHRAWTTREPTVWDILQRIRQTKEKTTIVTCTERAAALVNNLAQQVLFVDRHKQQIGEVAFHANLKNYEATGQMKTGVAPRGARTKLFKDMRVFLTKNVDKQNDFVNGMKAKVPHYNSVSCQVRYMCCVLICIEKSPVRTIWQLHCKGIT